MPACDLDAADPLAGYVDRFVTGGDVQAYLDGNSLGRPLRVTADRVRDFVTDEWGGRLIRGWDERWFDLPRTLGDRIASLTLGAGPGQTVVGESTTVWIYKLVRAALALHPGRTEIVIDRSNFPTDRYLVEGIAAETGAVVRWVEPDFGSGVTVDLLDDVVGESTAVVVVTHVDYRSGFLLDAPAVAALVRDRGALLLLDVCHSAGSVPIELEDWGVDLAVGCTYKYLNGGPGSPAFAYVAQRLLGHIVQPIWGWMGAAAPFEMGQGYVPAAGVQRMISGTPPVFGMLPMMDMLDLVAEVGVPAIRAKSLALTSFALDLVDSDLAPRGVTVSSPRDSRRRGGHITIDHPDFQVITARLWTQGIIPDFRRPHGIRLGLSPLSTTFDEVARGVAAIAAEIAG
ncbi:kynureninase [Williamsia sp. CHRR-6]|uniref:kynureninase n=1 Tax=Williamsia sp. CHRR-6 TaxID=2835871 RepID=UPI001BDA92AC|nr:aminotransferase class V-fold PLP-dependent enzyme [Williamsia sp. CHRR-6]MBT0566476.1 aminotransferase class V-fold PLP-dependent enzyme [Williamsia sp. CHRR-6]